MLFTISFPIADYRTLLNCQTYEIDMFNNQRFDFGRGFLRSFGCFSNRYSSKEYISPDEQVYANANNGIHFYKQAYDYINVCHPFYFDCVFRRAFFGPFSARFDIGLTDRYRGSFVYSPNEILESVNKALRLQVYSNTRRADRNTQYDDRHVALCDFASVLKKEYQYATTKDPKKNVSELNQKWLSARMPAVVVQSRYNEVDIKYKSSNRFRKIDLPNEWNIRLYYRELKNRIPLWVIVADREVNKERLRALRIWLLKWHQEKQSFQGIFSFMNSLPPCKVDEMVDANKVAEYLKKLLGSLEKKRQNGFPAYAVANAIMNINRQIDVSSEEQLLSYLDRHDNTQHLLGRTQAAMNNNFPFKKLDIVEDRPVVFISHTSPTESQKKWVKRFASTLEKNGITTILDLNNLPYGVRIPEFMEQALTISDYTFVICTPEYKKKADDRSGGVGYETGIITGDVYENHNDRRYVTVFPYGERKESTPIWAIGKKGVVLEKGSFDSRDLRDLIDEIKTQSAT